MTAAPLDAVPAPAAPRPPRWRRSLPWIALVMLLLVVQGLLVALTIDYEASRAQERVDTMAAEISAQLRREVSTSVQQLQALQWQDPSGERWASDVAPILRARPALLRAERRNARMAIDEAVDSPFQPAVFGFRDRGGFNGETVVACEAARRTGSGAFSRSYFVPQASGLGLEVMDLCIPLQFRGEERGFVVATYSLALLLDSVLSPEQSRQYELSFVEGDGTRLARSGLARGAGVYQAQRVVDLPGLTMQLRLDSVERGPRLIPNLATALVLGLSLALLALVVLLIRDVRRRAAAESALAEALAFRKAMEDSLITGLRARDLNGRITYANPAFCSMVGFTLDEMAQRTPPPYWPPERIDEYESRQSSRLALNRDPQAGREGFETVFMRRNGERFPVLIFEAPLVDRHGRHTGFMSAVLDVSQQRRMEELSRQQQERLQATARLATVGEMASLLSHELNQPLAAIASYATASLNLLNDQDEQSVPMVRQAVARIAEQAERAGRVIKSVHDFVRRREQQREALRADQLLEAVMPLVRLQARKSGARVEVDIARPAPTVLCDRTMVEQVLLNLTRNAIQAMEQTPMPERVLTLRVQPTEDRRVQFSVSDAGPGIEPEVGARLFTPFFTTRAEGMGLGLSLCRTVIEQHGGVLDFSSPAPGRERATLQGTEFRFTLPAPPALAAAARARAA